MPTSPLAGSSFRPGSPAQLDGSAAAAFRGSPGAGPAGSCLWVPRAAQRGQGPALTSVQELPSPSAGRSAQRSRASTRTVASWLDSRTRRERLSLGRGGLRSSPLLSAQGGIRAVAPLRCLSSLGSGDGGARRPYSSGSSGGEGGDRQGSRAALGECAGAGTAVGDDRFQTRCRAGQGWGLPKRP